MTGHCSGQRTCVCWQVCTYCVWSIRGSKRDVHILKLYSCWGRAETIWLFPFQAKLATVVSGLLCYSNEPVQIIIPPRCALFERQFPFFFQSSLFNGGQIEVWMTIAVHLWLKFFLISQSFASDLKATRAALPDILREKKKSIVCASIVVDGFFKDVLCCICPSLIEKHAFKKQFYPH